MKKKLMILALAAAGLASCNGGFKKGSGGLLYEKHVDKGGPVITPGDFISVNLVAKTDGDSVLFSTYEQGNPSLAVYQKPQTEGDVMSAFKYLAEGDSATIKVNIDSVYKKKRPPIKGKYVVYEVKVEKLIQKGKLTDTAFNNRITAYLKAKADVLAKQEPEKMKKYIADHKLTMTTTASGLMYVVTLPGSSEKPVPGDTAVMNYAVKFISGKLLETNIKDVAVKANKVTPGAQYKPIKLPMGTRGAILGLEEGLQYLGKGGKATYVIPSKLAYGEQGNPGGVPPYSPLVFDVELVDIIHANPNAPKPAPMVLPQAQKPASK